MDNTVYPKGDDLTANKLLRNTERTLSMIVIVFVSVIFLPVRESDRNIILSINNRFVVNSITYIIIFQYPFKIFFIFPSHRNSVRNISNISCFKCFII